MRTTTFCRGMVFAVVVLSVVMCSSWGWAESAGASGKIPVTTKSEEARKEFLQGQDLSDRLLAQDSLQHFDRAIALDPEFASAELARANNSPTTKEFFDHLKKAVALADKTSEGERLLILAFQAGSNGQAAKQKEYLDRLVAAFPGDERAQLALGVFYFGQQDFPQASEHLKKATEIAPDFSVSYNMLGYTERQLEDYAGAEWAFKKYVELIPNDPNPYDSYAELLIKMGRFEDSIAQYRKALAIDPHFASSHFGIAADLLYLGKPEEADAELQKLADQSRSDGEMRTALFGMVVVAADGGKLDEAQRWMDKEYAVAEKTSDVASMAADLRAKANISLQADKSDEAAKEFEHSFELIESSGLSQEIKKNTALFHHYNLAGVAIAKKDFAAAKTHAEEFRKGAEASGDPNQVKLAHELVGRIALAEKHYDGAIAELLQANLQDPQNLYRLYEAYSGKGDGAHAQEFCTKAAEFNSLPQLNYAFVRVKAKRAAKKS